MVSKSADSVSHAVIIYPYQQAAYTGMLVVGTLIYEELIFGSCSQVLGLGSLRSLRYLRYPRYPRYLRSLRSLRSETQHFLNKNKIGMVDVLFLTWGVIWLYLDIRYQVCLLYKVVSSIVMTIEL